VFAYSIKWCKYSAFFNVLKGGDKKYAKTDRSIVLLDARQTLAKTIVYSAWKGLNYARLRVIPYNLKSAAQQGVRTSLAYGVQYCEAVRFPQAIRLTGIPMLPV
jgi:hypothetical protein